MVNGFEELFLLYLWRAAIGNIYIILLCKIETEFFCPKFDCIIIINNLLCFYLTSTKFDLYSTLPILYFNACVLFHSLFQIFKCHGIKNSINKNLNHFINIVNKIEFIELNNLNHFITILIKIELIEFTPTLKKTRHILFNFNEFFHCVAFVTQYKQKWIMVFVDPCSKNKALLYTHNSRSFHQQHS